jgi:hypothetical protein
MLPPATEVVLLFELGENEVVTATRDDDGAARRDNGTERRGAAAALNAIPLGMNRSVEIANAPMRNSKFSLRWKWGFTQLFLVHVHSSLKINKK